MAPTLERRARHKLALREEILAAARDLFVREGYENVTMRRVAEKIEYSHTTIYLYFKDKAELLFAICQETFAKLLEEFAALEREPADPVTHLKRRLQIYIAFGLKHPQHYLASFVVPYQQAPPEDAARHLAEDSQSMRAFAYLRENVAACIRAGRFRAVDVETASRALWAAAHGVTSLFIVHPHFPWGDHEQVINLVVDSIVSGLEART